MSRVTERTRPRSCGGTGDDDGCDVHGRGAVPPGKALLADGRYEDALECFRGAHQVDRANPRYRSHYGLGLALVERRFDQALELCRSAAKEEFFNPELYHNLARVHMAFGYKSEAIRYLRRGLMIDPGDAGLAAELATTSAGGSSRCSSSCRAATR